MIFYSVINNNKIVIRQLLWIRARVCVSWLMISLAVIQEQHLGTGTYCTFLWFIFKVVVVLGKAPNHCVCWGHQVCVCGGSLLSSFSTSPMKATDGDQQVAFSCIPGKMPLLLLFILHLFMAGRINPPQCQKEVRGIPVALISNHLVPTGNIYVIISNLNKLVGPNFKQSETFSLEAILLPYSKY